MLQVHTFSGNDFNWKLGKKLPEIERSDIMAIEVSGAELKYIYDLDALLARPNSKKERMYQHSWAQDIYALLVEEAARIDKGEK